VALVAGALALGCAAALAPGAQATVTTVPCGELQAKIDALAALSNHGEGEVLRLEGMCDGTNLKAKTGVTIPEGADFTLEGAPGTTSGFDGNEITGPMLQNEPLTNGVGSMTIADLTFRNAKIAGEGAALLIEARQLTLSGDTFVEDVGGANQGGAAHVEIGPSRCPPAGSVAVTISGSTFRDDGLTGTEGGALWLRHDCPTGSTVLQGNLFEGNTLEAGATEKALGGALFFAHGVAGTPSVLQSGNVFAANRIVAKGAVERVGGAGEWLQGFDLTSVGDRFSGNELPGASGSSKWSWGAGLGILGTECNEHLQAASTLEDAVITGNSIGVGEPAKLGGAGLYVGCVGLSEAASNHLELLDSTVTENTTPAGGVAGIAGGPNDQLQIANSIIAGDGGGAEIGGFSGPGGALSGEFSDFCTPSTTSPFSGKGNICADPKLANDGNPASFDVHETGSSPTIDAGSNGLVPSGLGSDFFGMPRIESGRASLPPCTPGATIGYAPDAPTVDMGASENGPIAIPAIAFLCPPAGPSPKAEPPISPLTSLTTTVAATGLLQLQFKTLPAGKLKVRGTFKESKTVLVTSHGRHHRVRRLVTELYGQTSSTLSARAPLTIKLRPTGAALSALKRRGRLQVTLSTTLVTPQGTWRRTSVILVKYKPAKRHARG
jgi:hypothetical protein